MVHLLSLALLVGLLLAGAVDASALTASWQKNAEVDMKDYGVYMCLTKGCVVTKTPAMLQSYVPQVATGTPTYPIPPNTEGAIAVTARDGALNESGLSVSVPFDQVPPQVPASLIVQ